MKHSLTAQADLLRAGGAPTYELIEVLENVRDETRYLGAITDEAGERWPDQHLYKANFFAGRAVSAARNYIRNDTTHTTATADTMTRIRESVLYYVEKSEGNLS